MVFVLIGVSAHPVWIGLIFEYFFGVKWKVTPIANYANFFGAPKGSGLPGGPWQWFYHMILPWCTFAILFAALYVRMIRANVMETLNEDFVRTARAKGAPERRILFSHVLRNALLPVVTMLGMDIGVALGDGPGSRGVRHHCDPLPQPDRRRLIRLDRPPNPANLRLPPWPCSKSRT
jgi:peptide/nickel transport system permease protein